MRNKKIIIIWIKTNDAQKDKLVKGVIEVN